jgi:hypothetical protein
MARRELAARAGSLVAATLLVVYPLVHLRSTLPHTYLAAHWRVLWVGLDLAMAAVAGLTLALLARRSVLAALSASFLAALLVSDAWFDCLTARSPDLQDSTLSLIVELPGAAFFLWVAIGAIRREQQAREQRGASTR